MKGYTVSKRAVFVIDRQGVVRYSWISEDPGREPNYSEIEKALREIN
jgi:peroxiredoxin